MRFEALLRAHGFMKVERPPEIWEADTEDVRFLPLLGEMIASGLSGGATLSELTLNVSNIVVGLDEGSVENERQYPFPGEYVAVTVCGDSDLGPDGVWHPGGSSAEGLLSRLDSRFVEAGVRYAYVRRMPPTGSITVFIPRLRQNCSPH